jgi:hypothetical protein
VGQCHPLTRRFALFTGHWRALQHVNASPSRIVGIARAALVLTHFEHGYIIIVDITSLYAASCARESRSRQVEIAWDWTSA